MGLKSLKSSVARAVLFFLLTPLAAMAASPVSQDLFLSETMKDALLQGKIVGFSHPVSQWNVKKDVLLGDIRGTWVALAKVTGRTQVVKIANGLPKTFREFHFFSKSTQLSVRYNGGQPYVQLAVPSAPAPIKALLISWSVSECEDPGEDGLTLLMSPEKIQAILKWKNAGFPLNRKMRQLAGADVAGGFAYGYITLFEVEVSPSQLQRLGLKEGPVDYDLTDAVMDLERRTIIEEEPFALPDPDRC